MTVRSGHLVYKIYDEVVRGDCGEINFKANHIRIDSRMPETRRRETLLHEMVHMQFPWLEEEAVQMITHGMFHMICDNREAITKVGGWE